jgi:hypothetical protein
VLFGELGNDVALDVARPAEESVLADAHAEIPVPGEALFLSDRGTKSEVAVFSVCVAAAAEAEPDELVGWPDRDRRQC